jgi:hypothetical protein
MKHVTMLLAALVLVLGAHAITKADPPAGATKWQYLVVRGPDIALGELDRQGADGWELFAVVGEQRDMYFKRPKR